MMSGMKNLNQWSAGKKLGTVLLTRGAVASAGYMHGFFEWFRRGQGLPNFPKPPKVKDWLPLYRDNKRVLHWLVSQEEADKGVPPTSLVEFRGFCREIRQFDAKPFDEKLAIAKEVVAAMREADMGKAIADAANGELREQEREIAELLGAEDQKPGASDDRNSRINDRVKLLQQLEAPEGQFFVRVWVPCFVHYRTFPTRLFARARHGDVNAICDLLRLDKSVLAEPRIAEHVHQLAAKGVKRGFGVVGTAFKGTPGKLTRKAVKTGIAGLVSHLMGGLDATLNAPELRRAFDAWARDSEKGELRDGDLPLGDEAWAKEIQRKREGWPMPGTHGISFPPVDPNP